MEPDEIDVDDLVFEDDLDDALEEALSDVKTDPEELADEVAGLLDTGGLDAEDVQGITDATVQDRLEHLVHEDCDTPACNRLREEFDLNPSEDDGDGEDGADADSDGDGGNEESGSESESDGGDGGSAETEPGESGDAPEHAAFPDEL